MSLATGGRAIGATSTRSSSESWASCRAVSILTIPTCSPAGPTRRTSGTRMRSLIRGSVLICPPGVVVLWSCCGSYGALAERDGRRIHHRREKGPRPSSEDPEHHSDRRGRRQRWTDPTTGLTARGRWESYGWEIRSPLVDPARTPDRSEHMLSPAGPDGHGRTVQPTVR